jgi:hypothetical protein
MTPDLVSIKLDSQITRYSPVGKCIYCGADKYSGAEIRPHSDEHIIPEGLSGTLILPRASCRSCAKATGKIEGAILRTVFWAPRTHLKLRTKRPKERPTSFIGRGTYLGGTGETDIRLPIADYPTFLFLPELGPPGYLVGRSKELADMRGMWTYQMNVNPISLSKYGIKSIASAVLDSNRLSQMLAKIAHSYAAARLGLDGFRPILLEHIFSDGACPWHFIGCAQVPPPQTDALHTIGLYEQPLGGANHLIVRVRLFASLGAPDYLVVVGERQSSERAA